MKAKIKVSSGRPRNGGTILARQKVAIAKVKGRPGGKPIYQTRAQLNLHIDAESRPTKTELRGTD